MDLVRPREHAPFARQRAAAGVAAWVGAFGLMAGLAASATAAESEPASAPDPDAAGAMLAEQVCAKCHGRNGNSPPGDVPNLAGQQEAFLRKQLRAFKSHGRSDQAATADMWPVAHDLNERQIGELAAFFAAQKLQPQPPQGTREQIAAGRAIFARGAVARHVPSCAGCHGNDAQGKAAAPRLAGQQVGYLVTQFEVLQRTNDRPGAAEMRSVSHELSPQEIEDVAAYLQALPSIGAR